VVLDSVHQLLYHVCRMVSMTAPYIPGFLAFREADILCAQGTATKRIKDLDNDKIL
jgi:deoxyinosine 3'endonuclease (endonuclease V)